MPAGWQLRAARVAAGLDQADVAAAAGITTRTLIHREGADGLFPARPVNVARVVAVLAACGVQITRDGIRRTPL